MRIFINSAKKSDNQTKLDIQFANLSAEEKTRVLNGEMLSISADEMYIRVYGTTSFK
jgi:hypothetical protein